MQPSSVVNPLNKIADPRASSFQVAVVSSVHLFFFESLRENDGFVSVAPILDRWPAFRELLLDGYEEEFRSLRAAEGIGRPLGTADFVKGLERRLGRTIARRAPGRKAEPTVLGEQLNLLQ